MIKGAKSFIAISLVPLVVLAIESINPKSVCDRFVNSEDQKYCAQKMKKLKPDSYLSGICVKQFDDDSFWDCMELSQVASFDPKKMDRCSTNDFNDQQRISCLKEVAQFSEHPTAEFQSLKSDRDTRKPASH